MSQPQPYAATPASRFRLRPSRVLRTIREGGVARVLKLNTADAKVAEIFAATKGFLDDLEKVGLALKSVLA